MSETTPGQAAFAAYYAGTDPAPADVADAWNTLRPGSRSDWERAAQGAIDAATEGSLRACGYTLADIGRFLEAEAAAQERPAPARADDFARMKVKLSALVASMEDTVRPRENCELDDYAMSREFDDGAVHATAVTLRQLRAILDETALTASELPAPGLLSVKQERQPSREVNLITDDEREEPAPDGCDCGESPCERVATVVVEDFGRRLGPAEIHAVTEFGGRPAPGLAVNDVDREVRNARRDLEEAGRTVARYREQVSRLTADNERMQGALREALDAAKRVPGLGTAWRLAEGRAAKLARVRETAQALKESALTGDGETAGLQGRISRALFAALDGEA